MMFSRARSSVWVRALVGVRGRMSEPGNIVYKPESDHMPKCKHMHFVSEPKPIHESENNRYFQVAQW